MIFATTLFLALAAAPFALAANFEVSVGANGLLRYNPETVKAALGDTVTFNFNPKNHTVTQSSFAEPCVLEKGGFDSGFKPVNSTGGHLPSVTFKVEHTGPLWFYCKQKVGTHCGNGMVFAINPPNVGNTFEAFQARAISLNNTVKCTEQDKEGGFLTAAAQVTANKIFSCTYSKAGTCDYLENGKSSSGSKGCPVQVAQKA